MTINITTPTAPGYSTAAGALAGVALWALQTYAFNGGAVPGPVNAACVILIPAILSGIASLLTRRYTTPAAGTAKPPAAGQIRLADGTLISCDLYSDHAGTWIAVPAAGSHPVLHPPARD